MEPFIMLFVLVVILLASLFAAPAHTVRQLPTAGSLKVPEGYQTTIAFALDPTVEFWEQTVTPPGVDSGEPINTTTMLNTTWRNMILPQLKSLTPIKVKCFYDPGKLSNITALVGENGSITVWFPDGASVDFYGGMKSFMPNENKEKEAQLADVEIVPSNWDNVNMLEVGPVWHVDTGTHT